MMAHEKYTHISSSLIKEVLSHGGDIDDYIPGNVLDYDPAEEFEFDIAPNGDIVEKED